MGDSDILDRLQKRASESEEMIRVLRKQLAEMKKVASMKLFADEASHLKAENRNLEAQVEELLARLVKLEQQNGVPQFSILGSTNDSSVKSSGIVMNGNAFPEKLESPPALRATVPTKMTENTPKKPDKKTKPKPVAEVQDGKQDQDREADVSRLDLRVGLILNAKKHPDADSLYVEEVDVGEGKNRTVVSGLVKHVTVEEMQNRLAVLLCNLKPAKMRGVTSEAMVMCASTPEKVEILIPPPGSVPGDRVGCEGFVGEPDKELNPKKKIFEKVAPDLKTDSNRIATYKGVPWSVSSKGVVVAPTLTNVQIK